MISNELFRAKLGFSQIFVKKVCKLYFMGRLVFDSAQIKVPTCRYITLRSYTFNIKTVDGMAFFGIDITYTPDLGFDIRPVYQDSGIEFAFEVPSLFKSMIEQLKQKLDKVLFVSELKKVA